MAMQYRPLSTRRVVAIADAMLRLCANLEALSTTANSTPRGQVEALQVLWFCRVLKEDVLVCLAATCPDEADDDPDELVR